MKEWFNGYVDTYGIFLHRNNFIIKFAEYLNKDYIGPLVEMVK